MKEVKLLREIPISTCKQDKNSILPVGLAVPFVLVYSTVIVVLAKYSAMSSNTEGNLPKY